jgi:hypothetical protein
MEGQVARKKVQQVTFSNACFYLVVSIMYKLLSDEDK